MRARAFLITLCLALLACGRETPEARIKKAFEAGVHAVEAGDAPGAAEVLAPKFAGPEGMDRAMARLYLAGLLQRQKVGVTVLSQKVAVDGNQAVQSVDLLFTGRKGATVLPEDSSRRTLTLVWELRDGAWRIRELQQD